jgi:hypothetical protein
MILTAVAIIAVAAIAAAVIFDGRFNPYDDSNIADPGRGHIPELPAQHLNSPA